MSPQQHWPEQNEGLRTKEMFFPLSFILLSVSVLFYVFICTHCLKGLKKSIFRILTFMFKRNKSHSAVTPVESDPGRLVRRQSLVNIDSSIHFNNC